MLARGTLGRCAVATTSARDLPQLASFLHRILVTRKASGLPAALAVGRAYRSALRAHRCYATTTSATKPTATVKKAVKAQAASKAPPKKTAAASTKTKTAKKTAKKPAPKKTTKAKPKTKAKKAAPKKPAPKKRVKKVLTDEQKAAARIAELRKIALREPVTPGSVSAFNAYIADQFKSATGGDSRSKLTALSKAFKDLTPSEREHYNHIAGEQTAAKLAEYNAWIRSHTPEQIQAANNARSQLRTKLKGKRKVGHPAHTAKLVDDRHVKRPAGPYQIFFTERHLSGDMKGIAASESAKIIGAEWKALSAGEKKKYEDAHVADQARYEREKAAMQ